MYDRYIPLASFIPAVLGAIGLAVLVAVGNRNVAIEWGFLGVALCITAAVCHVHCRIEMLARREKRAFELGQESVRKIR